MPSKIEFVKYKEDMNVLSNLWMCLHSLELNRNRVVAFPGTMNNGSRINMIWYDKGTL